MNISWRAQRQIVIFTIYTLLIILPISFIVINLLRKDSSCFDGKLNGDETSIDCGGSCSLRCDGSYKNLKVKFARMLKTDVNQYNLFALIDNYNTNVSFPKIPYSANVYNEYGTLLISASGTISSLPQSQAVVFIPNINLKQNPKIVDFELGKYFGVLDLLNKKPLANVSTWVAQKSANNGIQVIGELNNPENKTINNISIYAMLYDDTKTVYAVGKTKVATLRGKEKTAIAFTWGEILKPTKVEFVLVYD